MQVTKKKWEHHLFAQLANIINDILFNFLLTQKQLNYNNRQKIIINHNHSPHKQKVVSFMDINGCVIVFRQDSNTVFPPIRPAGLIFSYFGNAGTISEQGSISVVTIS